MSSPKIRIRAQHLLVLAVSAVLLAGCSSLSELLPQRDPATQTDTSVEDSAADGEIEEEETVFESQFTIDGTFQSHIEIDGIDFVFTVWPTKQTPLTNEWHALGTKYFSFTLTAYDLDRDFRDPFDSKRRVWLERINVSSRTQTESGASERPYSLSGTAARLTFDPEPEVSTYGMLITSPKGAFEIRNQEIGALAMDTEGVVLSFEAHVMIQRRAGSWEYDSQIIRQDVPIRIFTSDEPTTTFDIPYTAN